MLQELVVRRFLTDLLSDYTSESQDLRRRIKCPTSPFELAKAALDSIMLRKLAMALVSKLLASRPKCRRNVPAAVCTHQMKSQSASLLAYESSIQRGKMLACWLGFHLFKEQRTEGLPQSA